MLGGAVVDEMCGEQTRDWRMVHARLLSLRQRRVQLDYEEMIALREAMRVQVWREVGAGSMRDYVERVLGSVEGEACYDRDRAERPEVDAGDGPLQGQP